MTKRIHIEIGYKFPYTELVYVKDMPTKRYKSGGHSRLVKCRCICASVIDIPFSYVHRKKNPIRSCGCLKGIPHPIVCGDVLNPTYTLIRRSDETDAHKNTFVDVICSCGNNRTLMLARLLRNDTTYTTCTCDHAIRERRIVPAQKSLLTTWNNMIARPTREKTYADKNITVCDEWMRFSKFSSWALGNGYNDALTLERRNNNGNYEPSNCYFIPIEQQPLNKSNTIIWNVDGIDYIGSGAATKVHNVSRATIGKWCGRYNGKTKTPTRYNCSWRFLYTKTEKQI